MAKDRSDFQAPKTAATTRKILLAEDDPDIRFILNLVLNDAGYEVETLSDGDTIVEENHQSPDLFILDKALPTTDGLEICKYLKSNEKTKDIPIIMISCYHDLKRKAKKSGVDDFIEKPFDLGMLLEMVDKNIKIHEHRSSGTGARIK
ncbi:MAG: response regulator [Cyclobacteriaceae bacterium]